MSSNDSTSTKQESTGLFRRMLKLVSSPKHDEGSHGSDYLSSEEKTQMLIRKQRNDLARRREFAELRELHRQRMLKENSSQTLLTGSDMSKTSTRQIETLNKINQLESQMASRWSKQQDTRPLTSSPTTLASTQQGASSSKSADGLIKAAPDASLGFGKDVAEHGADFLSATDMTTAGSRSAMAEEELQQAELMELADPALEEVGVLFASNEDEQVESTLNAMLAKTSPQRNKRVTWLTLMDFYRAIGKQTAFEALAMDYMTLFAESAPQWQVFDPVLLKKQQAAQASSSGAVAYWKATSTLDEENALTMQEKFDVKDEKVARLMDWSALQSVTPEGAKIVLGVLSKMDHPKISLQMTGGSTLMLALAAETKAKGSQGDSVLWQLRLEFLRLFDTAEEFDMEAMEYCLAHEVSPPAWVKPKCTCEDLDSAADGDEDADEDSSNKSKNATTIVSDLSTEFFGQNIKAPLRLRGAFKGSLSKELKDLDSKIFEDGGFLRINCERLVRIDFAAAGDLLNWISEKSTLGYSVQLVKVNRLVALFFIVMGISVSARISLRKD